MTTSEAAPFTYPPRDSARRHGPGGYAEPRIGELPAYANLTIKRAKT